MKPNLGTIDRAVRILIAIAIATLYFMEKINGTTAIILLAVAGIFIVTSFLSFCPIYYSIGLSSRKKNEHA